ncbi:MULTISPECIES: ArsR/SmtB family transcription factor [Fusobacterium]|uniref:ArsR/SmtB family transcription factor n=1 Tax=Fusobacterium TaxID=848 RepID=UPI001F4580E6|nr:MULTISPECIES: metalloregulator ArsR/SmtB family transcription factor [Fusobacterium]MCF2611936.1 helix-turn-helix transcriptional regulator [Fusobacterium perfoetens]MDY2981104.1 metalloregulator ArsR/SmtB family transcription factor [Fusobacterium sp.]
MDKNMRNAKIFKAFCDSNRLRIIEFLKNGEECACKLLEQLDIEQSTLSHHMRILCDSEIVKGRKYGKWIHYSLNKEKLEEIKKIIGDMM